MSRTDDVYIIRHKNNKTIFTAPSGKRSWKKPAHAKAAWKTVKPRWSSRKDEEVFIQTMGRLGIEGVSPLIDSYGNVSLPYFNEQDVYEVVEIKAVSRESLSEVNTLLTKAEEILHTCSSDCSPEVRMQIEEYFRSK